MYICDKVILLMSLPNDVQTRPIVIYSFTLILLIVNIYNQFISLEISRKYKYESPVIY